MQELNNLDVIILIVVGISALIALSRGLIKEVLSIVGWVLGTIAIVYLMPILTPIASMHIKSGTMAGIATAAFILIAFLIFWIMLTGKMVGTIRNSKLGSIDRLLGLFFGIARAFLLIVLFYILVNWMIPKDKQADVLTKSKYFNIAGEFAKPIEGLIPESTLKIIKEKAKVMSEEEEKKALEKDNKDNQEKKEVDTLFEKLAQPQVEKVKKEVVDSVKESFNGYKESERDNLNRLIENTVE